MCIFLSTKIPPWLKILDLLQASQFWLHSTLFDFGAEGGEKRSKQES